MQWGDTFADKNINFLQNVFFIRINVKTEDELLNVVSDNHWLIPFVFEH